MRSSGSKCLYNRCLVILGVVQNSEDSQEQVDDVEVKTNRSGNLLLHFMLSHNHLRVHQNVARENQRRDPGIYQFHSAVAREEHGHESKQNQCPEAHKEIWHPGGEVIFGLASDEGETDEESSGEQNGFEDDGGFVEGDYHGDGIGF